MKPKSEDPALSVAPRPGRDFVGLAAALAFIAASPSAAGVTEGSADQFRQDALSAAASLASPSFKAEDRHPGSFRLAQSTQGEDNGECNDYAGSNCNTDFEDQFGPFQYDYLPFDQVILEQTYDFQNEVYVDNIPNHWGPPNEGAFGRRMYGTGGAGVRCLAGGGAVTFIVKTRRLGCWRPAKVQPVRGLKVPPLTPAAQRVLINCRLKTGSVIIRKGGFACIATPQVVVRRAVRNPPVGPLRG